MSVTIQNKTEDRILLRFNSGLTRHLAPGETLASIEHVEVKGNARIKRLQERRVIVLRSGGDDRAERLGAVEETQ